VFFWVEQWEKESAVQRIGQSSVVQQNDVLSSLNQMLSK